MSRKNAVISNTIGSRLRDFRKLRNLEQTELGKILDTRASTVSDIENSKYSPGGKTLVALKTAFPDLNLNWLLVGEEPMLLDPADKDESREKLEVIRKLLKG